MCAVRRTLHADWRLQSDGKKKSPPQKTKNCLTRADVPARPHACRYEEVLFSNHLLGALRDYNSTGTSDPLFMMYAPHLVHSPYQLPADWLAKFDFIGQKGNDIDGLRQVYAAMTHYMDAVVGNVTAEMKRTPGMWENTLVIAASDNGGPIQGGQGASNFPLRGGKLTSWEGGVQWPGT